jgi:hypothetical protein
MEASNLSNKVSILDALNGPFVRPFCLVLESNWFMVRVRRITNGQDGRELGFSQQDLGQGV